MNILGTDARVVVGAGIAVGILAVYLANRAERGLTKAAAAAAESLNPLSANNIVYRGVNSVGEVITSNPDFSLGSWLWEALNPAAVEAEKRALGQASNLNPGHDGGGVL